MNIIEQLKDHIGEDVRFFLQERWACSRSCKGI